MYERRESSLACAKMNQNDYEQANDEEIITKFEVTQSPALIRVLELGANNIYLRSSRIKQT